MNDLFADVAVVGSGFGGTLTALILDRMGLRPVVIDRISHPRLVLGESSTPLANMLLKSLAAKYGLTRVEPLAEYGSWQRDCPELVCGLKRGFSYFGHIPGREFEPRADHANELLVAASFAAEDADTHWFRPDLDHFLVREIQAAGIPFFDRTEVLSLSGGEPWRLTCRRGDNVLEIAADFLIDASGEGGFLARQLGIPLDPDRMRTASRAVFGHFTGVEFWGKLLEARGAKIADHTFDCDAAALHHLFDGGWMYVLRFNNGVTSAGFMIDCRRHPLDTNVSPEDEWRQWLERYPSVAAQFSRARLTPLCGTLRRTPRLQRRARCTVGPNWAMLPLAAYTLDALHSSGNAHTLYGIERLASIFERRLGRHEFYAALQEHQRILQSEIDLIDQIVHGCYRGFVDFELAASFAMFYFAGAHNNEDMRRRGRAGRGSAFLLADNRDFRRAVSRCYDRLVALTADGPPRSDDMREYKDLVKREIAPFNIAGLCDETRQNMYPFIVPDECMAPR
jgi:FADH2 O2-dependent halogenase